MPKISGQGRVTSRLTGMIDENGIRLVGQALFAGGELIRAEAAHLITEHSVSGKGHIPSQPGEPPNEDTGDLRVHLETLQVAPLAVEVSDDSDHAVPLQVGTSKMAPRPYMDVATQHKRKEVVELVQQAVNIAIKRAGSPTAE